MKRWLPWTLAGIITLTVVLIGGAWLYARSATAAPAPEALAALQPDAQVDVTQNGWISFIPQTGDATTGLILYPGGFVDPRAYAPVARRIAEQGYAVVVPSMPLNLAVLRPNRAGAVMAAYPDVERWAIGGHSLGGAMAAQYASRHPDLVDGLVLWAAYPPNSVDLSASALETASIYGTLDGLVSAEDLADSRSRLPADTRFVPIEGGNHAQFGSYGPQDGDKPATISASEQLSQIAAATVETLRAIEDPSATRSPGSRLSHLANISALLQNQPAHGLMLAPAGER
jgi:dienelactone hydrolase